MEFNREYELEKFRHRLPNLNDPSFTLYFYTRPETLASAWGQAVGNALSQIPSGLPGLFAFHNSFVAQAGKIRNVAAIREMQKRIPAGCTLVLSGSAPLPLSTAGLLEYCQREDQYKPMEALRDYLGDKVQNRLAKDLVLNNLAAVRKELDAKKGKPEEARKYLEEAIKKYDLQHGVTEKPVDQYAVRTDPQMKSLLDSYKKAEVRDPRGKQFYQLFFNPIKPYQAEFWPFDRTSEEPFLFWKTSDKAAYVPSFAEVKDQVEAAWKFAEARKLARKEAEEVADKARQADRADAILQKTSPNSEPVLTLDAVTRLRHRPLSRIGTSRQYEPYTVPEDKVEYPSSDFIDQLLSLKQEKGEALVLTNQPESIFYVAARVTGREPTLEEFYSSYRNAGSSPFGSDPMLSLLERERRQRYYASSLEQLRAEARLTINKDQRRSRDEGEMPVEE
jgi:hypothetical protein